jgi:uncharacterized protein involved in cysteine biosynthesis
MTTTVCKIASDKKERVIDELQCVLLLLPVVVIALLLLLGPAIGNVFSRISSGLY